MAGLESEQQRFQIVSNEDPTQQYVVIPRIYDDGTVDLIPEGERVFVWSTSMEDLTLGSDRFYTFHRITEKPE